jgi:hypothetical protein
MVCTCVPCACLYFLSSCLMAVSTSSMFVCLCISHLPCLPICCLMGVPVFTTHLGLHFEETWHWMTCLLFLIGWFCLHCYTCTDLLSCSFISTLKTSSLSLMSSHLSCYFSSEWVTPAMTPTWGMITAVQG